MVARNGRTQTSTEKDAWQDGSCRRGWENERGRGRPKRWLEERGDIPSDPRGPRTRLERAVGGRNGSGRPRRSGRRSTAQTEKTGDPRTFTTSTYARKSLSARP